MRRRDVFQSAALAATAAVQAHGAKAKGPAKPVLMKVGTQNSDAEDDLTSFAAFGVNNICSGLPSKKLDEAWSVESLVKLRERVEKHGIKLDMVPLPLSSAYITRAEYPAIMMGTPGERDKAIDDVCKIIRNIAQAGIPAAKYNMSILGVVRTPASKGRGGADYSTFKYAEGKQEPALTEAGKVDPDTYWERITYFLERAVPVAAENKLKIACHPNDPGMPNGKNWRGVVPVLGRVDGLKRFISIKENPYHGLNFCQGTICEGLENPNKEIHEVIRYFGAKKKIFNVHFRNIEGKIGDFRETFPDNGDVNMIEAIRTYREVGFDVMIMPDHVPHVGGDPRGAKSFAFCFGYIQALIQQLKMEG
jgi:mannonate dehydratase